MIDAESLLLLLQFSSSLAFERIQIEILPAVEIMLHVDELTSERRKERYFFSFKVLCDFAMGMERLAWNSSFSPNFFFAQQKIISVRLSTKNKQTKH